MVTGDRTLISISYTYNAREVLSLTATGDSGTTKAVITYYMIALTLLIMLPFHLLLVQVSCLSYLDL